MANEQIALSFNKGITNVPGDATCDDNALEESLGMVFEDGEHKPIQNPSEHMTGVVGQLVYVHTKSGENRYIYAKDGNVYWNQIDDSHLICSYSGTLHVEAIHGTLIVSDDSNTIYALWKSGEYSLIREIPDFHYYPKLVTAQPLFKSDLDIKAVNFPLNTGEEHANPYKLSYQPYYIWDDGTIEEHGGFYHGGYAANCVMFTISNEIEAAQTFQNAVIGSMEEHLNSVKENNAFTFPFWVRFAVELWDGSITRHSAPILMWPSIRRGCCFRQTDNGSDPHLSYSSDDNNWMTTEANAEFLHVTISCNNISGDLTDIIKSVKVYVSQEVRNCYLNEEKWAFYCPASKRIMTRKDMVTTFASEGLLAYYSHERMDYAPGLSGGDAAGLGVSVGDYARLNMSKYYRSFLYPKPKTDDEIKKELIETSVFYELCSIPYGDIASEIEWYDGTGMVSHKVYTEQLMSHNALVNLTTLPQMPKDDFYSHSTITGGGLFAYNSRLNVFGFTRKLFEGFDVFSSENTNSYQFRIVVYVKGDQGELMTFKDFSSNFAQGYFFFYPDSRAQRAELYIRKSNGKYALLRSVTLKEHPYLNGAYFFEKLPYDTGSVRNWMDTYFEEDKHYYIGVDANPQPPTTRNDTERPENAIMTSEVNNPMTFYAEGYNLVGMGKILGLATQTVALSSGTPFGSQPLIVFSDRGLWAMTVDDTGLYKSSAPLPREVCCNPRSITMTDGVVFFASEKGLMSVIGEQVVCVSEQLRGKIRDGLNFHDFLLDAEIGYDYRDGLLWIARSGSRQIWIYNIRSSAFAHFELDAVPESLNFVNFYPDYLMQVGSTIFSFMERPDANLDEAVYKGTIITRPMKFENALALKSIREIRNVSYMDGSLKYRLYASNDLKSWVELKSLRGMPWKYYKMRFDFADMKATDRFAGTAIVTQERRTNKMR